MSSPQQVAAAERAAKVRRAQARLLGAQLNARLADARLQVEEVRAAVQRFGLQSHDGDSELKQGGIDVVSAINGIGQNLAQAINEFRRYRHLVGIGDAALHEHAQHNASPSLDARPGAVNKLSVGERAASGDELRVHTWDAATREGGDA